jgi:hypothetical protein
MTIDDLTQQIDELGSAGFPINGKSRRERETDDTRTPGPRRTDGSNPSPSSGESANFRFLAGTIRLRPSSETTPSRIVMILRMSTMVSSLPTCAPRRAKTPSKRPV